MATKLKKVNKKPMNPKTKAIIADSFKGVISNQSCINNGQHAPWWLAIIFALVAIIIPLIPNFVRMSNAYGSSFLRNGSYGLDRGLAKASVYFENNHKDLRIIDHHLHYLENGEDKSGDSATVALEYEGIYRDVRTGVMYYDPATDTQAVGSETNFTLHYTTKWGTDLENLVNRLLVRAYVRGSASIEYDGTNEEHQKRGAYTPNFMVLAYDTMFVATFKSSTPTKASNSMGGLDYSKMNDMSLIKYIVGDRVLPINEEEILENPIIVSEMYTGWKYIIDASYLRQRDQTKWNTTLIYLGVYAGLLVFLGLMVFLLTRGKNNPFRSYNFWVCQKISYFLSFTPALLAMVLSFIITADLIGQMAFIMLVSLRVMWASMRQLRPIQ